MMNQACKDYVLKILAYGTIFSQVIITGTCIKHLRRRFSVIFDSYTLIRTCSVDRVVSIMAGMYAETPSKVDRYNNDSIIHAESSSLKTR